MDLLSDLRWRGLVHQTTDDAELPKLLGSGRRTIYAGFDPTADSLHVGNFVAIMMLRRFQNAGHRPIALVGGATGMIGDPSGKSEERNLLTVEQLAKNVAGIEQVLRRFLDFDSPESAILVNNFDWMQGFSYLGFLRDVGKHFPVNAMLAKDSVKSRLSSDAGISYTEFSYMLLQAYDFAHLAEQHGCLLQTGGSDQWGNITAGIDLCRRMRPGTPQLYGLTFPLLLKSDGSKMGKTASGALWLTADRTGDYEFYQYWINVRDEDVGRCLRVLTELSHEEIEALDAARAVEPHKRESQKRLAEWLTELVHGKPGLERAQKKTQNRFEGLDVDDEDAKPVAEHEINQGLSLVKALAIGLALTGSAARRAIEGGGVYVNDKVRKDISDALGPDDIRPNNTIKIAHGKKKVAILRVLRATRAE